MTIKENNTEDRKYIVIWPHSWGKGSTMLDAFSNCMIHGEHSFSMDFHVYAVVPDGSYVDEMGYIHGVLKDDRCKRFNEDRWRRMELVKMYVDDIESEIETLESRRDTVLSLNLKKEEV